MPWVFYVMVSLVLAFGLLWLTFKKPPKKKRARRLGVAEANAPPRRDGAKAWRRGLKYERPRVASEPFRFSSRRPSRAATPADRYASYCTDKADISANSIEVG